MADVVAARITIPVNTNAGQATSQLSGLDNQLNKTASTTGKFDNAVSGSTQSLSALGIGAVATASYIGVKLVGAMADFIGESVKLASDAEETRNKFNVTFSGIQQQAEETAQALAKSYGLAGFEAQKLLSDTGDLLTGFGFTQQEALGLSNELNKLAVDLASFTNIEGGAERASKALTSALFGEREAVKQLGIVIREEDITARLAAKGMGGLTGQALLQAKAQETLRIAYEQSKNAIGDFARSSDSYANQQRILNAQLKDFKVAIGKEVLPALQEMQRAMIGAIGDAEGLGTALGSGIRKAILVFPLAGAYIDEFEGRINVALLEIQNSFSKFLQGIGATDLSKSLAINPDVINNAKSRLGEYQAELERIRNSYDGVVQKKDNDTRATINNTQAIQSNAKELEKALKIAASAGDLSAQLLLMRRQYAEQFSIVSKNLGDTTSLQLFHLKKREQDLIKHFETRASIESEDSSVRLEWLKMQYAAVNAITYQSAEERLATEKALARAIQNERQKMVNQFLTFGSSVISSTQSLFTDLQTIFQNVGTQSYELAVILKGIAMAEAAINTALAYTKTLAAFPYPFNMIAAGIVLAAGIAKQVAIATTPIPTAQFGGSFIVPPGNQADSGLLRVNQGERVDVTPARETSNMPSTMTLMIDGRSFKAYVVETAAAGFNSGHAQIRRKGAVKTA